MTMMMKAMIITGTIMRMAMMMMNVRSPAFFGILGSVGETME
jgi:hypothetical protein